MRTEQIRIRGDYIRLCDLLKFSGVSPTGGEAKNAIEGGKVFVNEEPCLLKGKKIHPGDTVQFDGQTIEVIGGAG